LPIAQQLLTLEAEASGLLRDSGTLSRGQLQLGAVGPFHVIEMVDAYRRAFPQIDLSIRIGNSASVLPDLESYVIDVGVLAGLHEDPAFQVQLYARHPVILFAPVEPPWLATTACASRHCRARPCCAGNRVRPHGQPSSGCWPNTRSARAC